MDAELVWFRLIQISPRMGADVGFVISDYQGLDRITTPPHANYSYSVETGINAGIDMVMIHYNYTKFIDVLMLQVQNKIIPMSRIDDAVKRILTAKFVMGLFEKPMADTSLVNEIGSQEHRKLTREAVRKSRVLLKNGKSADKPLLPVSKKAPKILVPGSNADNLGYQCGGCWQGLSGNNLTSGTTFSNKQKLFESGVARDRESRQTLSENPKGLWKLFERKPGLRHSMEFGISLLLTSTPAIQYTVFDQLKSICCGTRCKVMIQAADPDEKRAKDAKPKPPKTMSGTLYAI
ncbi:Beta-glucosidase like [Thalictrum thalictroides]|uniref:beta-glucosidase n=1 Tax=Thalictrum thalictroides TaxID=46969 RepID=A0A7J6WS73_THATH|nr:Beta-glucosidase like [Thalictrum thalictroides]